MLYSTEHISENSQEHTKKINELDTFKVYFSIYS